MDGPVLVVNIWVGDDLQAWVNWWLRDLPEPVDVTVTVSDESIALLSADGLSVGSKSITFEDVHDPDLFPGLAVQGLTQGTTTMTISAPGYLDVTQPIEVKESGFTFTPTGDFTVEEGADPEPVWVRSYLLTSYGALDSPQQVRPGAVIRVDLSNSDDAVGTLSESQLVFTGPSHQESANFVPLSPGSSTISLAQPVGFTEPTNGRSSITATVTPPPEISIGDVLVGRNLQSQWITAGLSVAPPSPTDVTVSVDDQSTALLSTRGDQVGSGSITFEDVSGTDTGGFVVQGLALGTTTLTVSAPGYPDATATITVTGSGFDLTLGDFETAANSPDVTIYASLFAHNQDGGHGPRQGLRGGFDATITLTSSDETVGTLVEPELTLYGGGTDRLIAMFDTHAAGTATISLTQPLGFTTPTGGRSSVTGHVVEPQILLDAVTVDEGQVTTSTVRLVEQPDEPTDLSVGVEVPILEGPDPVAQISMSPDGPWSGSVTFEGVTDTSENTVYVKGVRAGTVGFGGYSRDLYRAHTSITVPESPALAAPALARLRVGSLHLDPIVFALSRRELPAVVRSASSGA